MLTFYEELQVLSIHADKGIFVGLVEDRWKPGLAGAILAELAMAGKIRLSSNRRLHIADTNPTNDPLLDDALATLKEADKERKFGYWISNLCQKPEKLRRQVILSLVQKGVLAQEDDRLIWAVPSPVHPEVKASTKYSVIEHLRGIVLARQEAHPREVAFLSLLSACGLVELVFLRDERKLAVQAINELVVFHAMQDPAVETIQEISDAITSSVEED